MVYFDKCSNCGEHALLCSDGFCGFCCNVDEHWDNRGDEDAE